MLRTSSVVGILAAVSAFHAGIVLPTLSANDATSQARQEYEALQKEYEEEGGARLFAKRFVALAEKYPRDAAAFDALEWVVTNVRGRAETTRALELLSEHHAKDDRLAPIFMKIADSRSTAAESFFRKVMKENDNKQTQGEAGFWFAALLEMEARIKDQLENQPEMAKRVLQYYGKEYGQHLSELDAKELEKKREELFVEVLNKFDGIKVRDVPLVDIAKQQLFRIRHLSVGKEAPEIEGETINGEILRLSDYRGKVVMLTFWGHW